MLLKISSEEKMFKFLLTHIQKSLSNIIGISTIESQIISDGLKNIDDISVDFDTDTQLLIANFNNGNIEYKIDSNYLSKIYE